MSEEKKNKTIAASVTTAVMIALLLLMLFCGLSYQNPPPPAKKAILIELSTMGGGGGGGNEAPSQQKQTHGSAENIVTQNSEDAPTIPRSDKKVTNNKPTVEEQKVDPNSMYTNKGRDGGRDGVSGPGSSGKFGDDEGPGHGGPGGLGYCNPNRAISMPKLTLNQSGTVYVEVHIRADGSVHSPRILTHGEYKTTITDERIWKICKEEALKAKYKQKPGKEEELGIIVFVNN